MQGEDGCAVISMVSIDWCGGGAVTPLPCRVIRILSAPP